MFDDVAAVSSRLKVTEIACNFFRSIVALTPEDLLPTIYLCTSKVAPAYEGLEVGIGDASLVKAIAEATGRSVAQIKSDAEKSGFVFLLFPASSRFHFFPLPCSGDLGEVAQASRSNQGTLFPPPPLTIRGVFKEMKAIAQEHGQAVCSLASNFLFQPCFRIVFLEHYGFAGAKGERRQDQAAVGVVSP